MRLYVRAKCLCDAASLATKYNVRLVSMSGAYVCSLSGSKHNTYTSLGSAVVLLRTKWKFFLQHGQVDGVSSRFNPEENTL